LSSPLPPAMGSEISMREEDLNWDLQAEPKLGPLGRLVFLAIGLAFMVATFPLSSVLGTYAMAVGIIGVCVIVLETLGGCRTWKFWEFLREN